MAADSEQGILSPMNMNGPLGATAPRSGFEARAGKAATGAQAGTSRWGQVALAGTVALGLLISISATRTKAVMPEFLPTTFEGPFGKLGLHLPVGAVLASLAMVFVCYLTVLRHAERLSIRSVLMAIAALNALLLLGPPLFSMDIFSYQGYAREWLTYGANPYLRGASIMQMDPIYPYIGAKWISTPTVYGPLFTAASGLLAHVSVAAGLFWFKLLAVLSSLGTVAIIWHASRLRGLDPRRGVVLFGLNPLVVLYGVGGGHNDLITVALSTAAVWALLAHRQRLSGVSIMLATAIKLTAGLALPFALAAGPELGAEERRRRLLVGAAVTSLAIAGLSFGLFGLGIFNLIPTLHLVQTEGDWHSIPGFISAVVGKQLGQAAGIVLGLVFAVALVKLLRRVWRGEMDWVDGMGWATLIMLVTASAILPWYVCWLLPVVALATDRRLWRWSLIISGILLFTTMLGYVPTGDTFLGIPVVP
ncbi:MAG TPA: glycosyltransferase family 87 protein [Solirubrobacteraceae bacterium]|nr:glycosyltransferase family 87 protein [Solirubrobacteraceae bacterium]